MIPVSSAAALHSDAAPPVVSAGPASQSSARSQECRMLRHILHVSDTLLLLSPYSVSSIVPGVLLEQLQVVCSKVIRTTPSAGGGGAGLG